MKKIILYPLVLFFVWAFSFNAFGQSLIPKKYYAYRTVLGESVALIQDDSFEGWTKMNGRPVEGGWVVSGNEFHRKSGGGGDIISVGEFGDFILDFEWKISKGVNSGLKYKFARFNPGGWLGPEYQILDDPNNSEGTRPTHTVGSLYDIKGAEVSKPVMPVGEYNHSRVVVRNGRIEHWLNGKKVVEIRVGSKEWNELFAKSKFTETPDYAKNEFGKIMLQDHGGEVWFRNITVREFTKQKVLVSECLFGKRIIALCPAESTGK